jgi:hypothetical protein
MFWHAIRAPVGAAFLVMASEDLLPDLFAKRAGYGDILTALCGVLVVAISPVLGSQKAKSVTYFAWNIIGPADLAIAVGTGIYLALKMPDSMISIVKLPLLLVPTFILPVLFATHIIMLKRLTNTSTLIIATAKQHCDELKSFVRATCNTDSFMASATLAFE